jgi:CDP-glucose 4,6-dehydratase
MTKNFWANKRVFLTGHTGFKGAWLGLWLTQMGARVRGYALPPQTEPNLFTSLELSQKLEHVEGDIRDEKLLTKKLMEFKPEIVLHLAAQAIVSESYKDPVETYSTNVMGTLNLLQAIRSAASVQSAVIVTSDKCYENPGKKRQFLETDPLGGADLYSSSKACTEIVTASYSKSFLGETETKIATARAGNVIGGGDFSAMRIIPDIIRAVRSGRPLVLRRPQATRPWQHVLEPLSGYLTLAEKLWQGETCWNGGWNFGPDTNSEQPVIQIVEAAQRFFPSLEWRAEPAPFEEAQYLALDSSKARVELGWRPGFDFQTGVEKTLAWYQLFNKGESAGQLTSGDIRAYEVRLN